MPYTVKKRRSRKPFVIKIVVLLGIVAVIAGLFVLYSTNHLPFYKKPFKPSITGNSETKGEQGGTPEPSTTTPPPSDDENKGQTSPSGSTATLLAPNGNFVSNHHPHLSNNPAGSAYLASTCTTTPGATCQITFTKDGVTKSLPAETTDAGGSAYWNNWRPQDYGIGEGTWTIQAVATLDGQTKTAADALTLEVTQ